LALCLRTSAGGGKYTRLTRPWRPRRTLTQVITEVSAPVREELSAPCFARQSIFAPSSHVPTTLVGFRRRSRGAACVVWSKKSLKNPSFPL
jgi:hypothetical protein